MSAGQTVELRRAVATTMFLVEKGKRGVVQDTQNGWLFVRFDGQRTVVPVMACEVNVIEQSATA